MDVHREMLSRRWQRLQQSEDTKKNFGSKSRHVGIRNGRAGTSLVSPYIPSPTCQLRPVTMDWQIVGRIWTTISIWERTTNHLILRTDSPPRPSECRPQNESGESHSIRKIWGYPPTFYRELANGMWTIFGWSWYWAAEYSNSTPTCISQLGRRSS